MCNNLTLKQNLIGVFEWLEFQALYQGSLSLELSES